MPVNANIQIIKKTSATSVGFVLVMSVLFISIAKIFAQDNSIDQKIIPLSKLNEGYQNRQ